MAERCTYKMFVSWSIYPRILCRSTCKGSLTSWYPVFGALILLLLLVLQLSMSVLLKTDDRPTDNYVQHVVRKLTELEYANLEAKSVSSNRAGSNIIDLCDAFPHGLEGKIEPLSLLKTFPEVRPGGFWRPTDCEPRHTVAIVVPYRDRLEHLEIFLKYIHTILFRQKLEYRIFIVEQATGCTFNRGMLMNIGFLEAMKHGNFSCIVFHDVDLLPEMDDNLYSCSVTPKHMSVNIDKFDYRIPYDSLFGGVVAFSKDHFKFINGFANRYFGWGGEDDDIKRRVDNRGLTVIRPPDSVARYSMLKHGAEAGNKANPIRYFEMKRALEVQNVDGLSSMAFNPNMYKVLDTKLMDLYTKITVEIHKIEVLKVLPTLFPIRPRHPWISSKFRKFIAKEKT
ncbi:beta-1,4-N-acetylgalactosaminyltransferase bre-4-like isoform X1 [Lingula anatina]|uniref:Beta-1,4-galactosyltransferase n=1 Tax=Lingula anatina TaxID=7574 RepID=A0A1S3HHF8_LINAN|nr:beta-1,4-N-acetylgalactosaminyltransferase bre-4-like isoform X1 [Lingula anatina]|eukprot:XP_013385452.1 beta-1,4-N-acetylgalactosaminyltransferase bre-4-like isoform X1 [Lingula anatina]